MTTKKTSILWPDIYDIKSAKKAIAYGTGAAVFLAIFNFIYSFFLVKNLNFLQILGALFYVIIAWGIHKRSRSAASLGLGIYFLERIIIWFNSDFKMSMMGLSIIFFTTLFLIGSIRGTIAYHVIVKSKTILRNIVIKNLLALLYSSISSILLVFVTSIADFGKNYSFNSESDIMRALLLSLFMIIYLLTVGGFMPFTKNRQMVIFPASENEEVIGVLNKLKSFFSNSSPKAQELEVIMNDSFSVLRTHLNSEEKKKLAPKVQDIATDIMLRSIKHGDRNAIQVGFIAMAHNITLLVWELFGTGKSSKECISIADAALNLELYAQFQNSEVDSDFQAFFGSIIVNRILYTQLSSLIMRIEINQLDIVKSIARTSLDATYENDSTVALQKITASVAQMG
jgi:hypothetical protein